MPLIAQHTGADSASVFDAISAQYARNADIARDAAGRLNNKAHLMEDGKIVRVLKKVDPDAPHETLRPDAGTGQNAVAQARESAAVGITGIALTKLDGTASMVFAIGQEVKANPFIGIGEAVDDLRPFDPSDFVNALFTPVD